MINFSLLKSTVKSNWIIFIIFFAILFMYMSVMLGMYDPDNIDAMAQMTEALPQGMMEAFGYEGTPTDLSTFMAIYYYGFIILMFPMIYCIILASRLVASHVDRGSMAYLLATPNTRVKIIVTQAVYMALSIYYVFFLMSLSSSIFSNLTGNTSHRFKILQKK